MDKAKLFINGRSQAVRLPKEYRFKGSEIYIKKFGDIVLLIPKYSEWKVMEKSLDYFTEDYLSDRNQPQIDQRDDI